jgi:hypothetical protein
MRIATAPPVEPLATRGIIAALRDRSVLVPVPVMRGMAVPIVEIIDVIAVRDRIVTATVSVRVPMIVVHRVSGLVALVPMPIVFDVGVPIVEVVDVITMLRGRVPAIGPVLMAMIVVGEMFSSRHRRVPFGWVCVSSL